MGRSLGLLAAGLVSVFLLAAFRLVVCISHACYDLRAAAELARTSVRKKVNMGKFPRAKPIRRYFCSEREAEALGKSDLSENDMTGECNAARLIFSSFWKSEQLYLPLVIPNREGASSAQCKP